MSRGRPLAFLVAVIAVASVAVIVVAILIPDGRQPNADGWWDEGVHAVDGYWVKSETECVPGDSYCQTQVRASVDVLHVQEPDAVMTKAWMASYPQQRKRYGGFIGFAGLANPAMVILDLADGRRRMITLRCGAFGLSTAYECRREALDMFKVGHGRDLGYP